MVSQDVMQVGDSWVSSAGTLETSITHCRGVDVASDEYAEQVVDIYGGDCDVLVRMSPGWVSVPLLEYQPHYAGQ